MSVESEVSVVSIEEKEDCSLVSHGDQGNDDSRVFGANGLADDDNVEKFGGGEDSVVESELVCNGSSDLLVDGSVEEREDGDVVERDGEVLFVNGSHDGSGGNEENGVSVEKSCVESVPVVEIRDGDSDVLDVQERENGNMEKRDGSGGNEENGVSVGKSCVESVPVVEIRDGDSDVLDVEERENGNVEKRDGSGGNEENGVSVEKSCVESVPVVEIRDGNSDVLDVEERENGNVEKRDGSGGNEENGVSVEKSCVESVPVVEIRDGDSDVLDVEERENGNVEKCNASGENEENGVGAEDSRDESVPVVEFRDGNSDELAVVDSDLDLHPVNNEEILTEKEELDNFSSHEKADNAAGENQITDETLSVNSGSSDVVVDAVESVLLEASADVQVKAELEVEVIECSELEAPVPVSVDVGPEFPPTDEEKMLKENGESKVNLTSCDTESNDAAECELTFVKLVDSDVDLCPINSEETLEKEEAKATIAFDVIENQKQVAKVSSLKSITDQHLESVSELVSDDKVTACISASDVDDTVQYLKEPEKYLDVSEIVEVVASPLANGQKAEYVENNTSIEPESKLDTVVFEKEPAFQSGDKEDEAEASNGNGKLVHVPSPTVNTKSDHGKIHTTFSVTYKKDLLESFNINREAASNITWGSGKIRFGTANVEDIGDKSDGNPVISHGNLTTTENKHMEICKNCSVSIASSGTDEVCGEELSVKPVTIPFHYLVRVPRFDDESLKERIKLQELQLDDWTQRRDAIRLLIQETRKAIDESHGVNYENARNHVTSAWKLVRAKRVEMDSLQLTINKVKSAASVQDIDQRICNMEYMIQHETMPLKEEKQLIHELKQKKQLRKQLSSNIGSHDEIKESREQLEKLEKSMKSLKKELEILKGNAEKAEAVLAEEKRKCDFEYKKVEERQARYRVANDSRQEAYIQLKSLRKELKEKNKHFYKYKDDATAANNYAHSKDIETLHSQCKNQVEKFMELWNNNDEFRKEYVTFNAKSTVRRFGTLDGRALGPNEERQPPVISSYVDQKVHKLVATPAKIDSVSKSPVLELKEEIKLGNGSSEEKTNKKLTKSKGTASANDKEAAESVVSTVSSKNVSEDVQVEVEPTKSIEEIVLERNAEEMKKREDEAKAEREGEKLKERLRLEEIAKAQEARERKKRKEEKEKRRAELRSQKEAEQKEKEREKRLRKKEKRNTSTAVTAESSNSIDPAPIPENITETAQKIEVPKTSTTSKKPQRPVFTKWSKPGVIQSPPQIRRKRNWLRNPWIILAVIIAAVSIVILYNTYLKREVTLGV